ncbi:LacI family DNA-binding transcriptional regulator [Paenibacillus sp. DXFW5]|uniref:LacI family DNA-binding transcriptional regulator n=1 Tax=Paenibacillus rhizolycopersici TaxID=2780073 RepID=A0ABS2GZI2_9BACL|nr:LacI family DNA-binding transcriptional regulator [Paenibacillus rhizolycopersici]MBM6994317.1 LacI family DNA-binding transcriptional regulator [Paenibacillus rhizolycopersici]
MITIYDIAQFTGFSPTTVSKVFNGYSDVSEKTRRKILDAADELGYVPNAHARSLTTKRSWMIGVLFIEPSGAGILHPYFGGVIEGFKQVATSKGYDLMFISKDIGGKRSGYLEHCKIRGIDGVVVVLPDASDPYFQELLESKIPCVLLDQKSTVKSTVYSDNAEGVRKAVSYLHSIGHRKIAHIGGGPTFAGEQRLNGYIQAMEELGLTINPQHVVQGSYDYTIESGSRAMEELLKADERPTAVFAAGDNLAVGAMMAMKRHGLRVPEDISLVGFDDIEMAKFLTPALTTVRQNTYVLGSRAADMLIYSIEGGEDVQKGVIPVELVVRESCRSL